MLLITAPSKTQEPISPAPQKYSLPPFLEKSAELVALLRRYSLAELCTLMKMSPRLGERTAENLANFQLPFTQENAHQALFTFQGDAYSAITATAYQAEQLDHAQRHLRILSGLYGILRPLDLMQPYRLEMGLKLPTEQETNLYQFWGNLLTEQINKTCERHGHDTVVNLASNEYSRSINKKLLQPRFLTITFKEQKAGGYKTIPIYSKRARGMMIDTMIRKQLTTIDQLQSFNQDNYAFSEEFSKEKEWVFTRETLKK
ncbi:MAG: hypothetical protein CSB28_00585 [Desulfobacterales bacterium]|nr:MAG: hypothetical protein CSB28_00585 [Desulfobacterales bacterium]